VTSGIDRRIIRLVSARRAARVAETVGRSSMKAGEPDDDRFTVAYDTKLIAAWLRMMEYIRPNVAVTRQRSPRRR
jgi:hypothetical protein